MTAPLQSTPLQPAPRSALVISLRFLGDVLLSTPIVEAIGERYPGCEIDMLVFGGCEAILAGNPRLRRVITTRERAPRRERLALLRALWRRYDLAVATTPGDRPLLHCFGAGRERVGFVPLEGWQRHVKRMLLTRSAPFDPHAPRLAMNDRVAQLFGAERAGAIVPPTAHTSTATWQARLGFDPSAVRFAVLHPSPRWRYKRWTDAGWHAAIDHLLQRGLRIVVTGGPGAEERGYLDGLLGAEQRVTRVDGSLSLAEASDLLKLASLYLGPDTATTHLAAACGTPTLALFGPTDPVVWGPNPSRGAQPAYARVDWIQKRENVALMQNPTLPCMPCQFEGCERHRESYSECLDRLPFERVRDALDELLALSLRPAR